MSTIINNDNSGEFLVKCGEGNTNSPKLLLLKFLPLAYHHNHFLAITLGFTFFSQWPSSEPHTFYSWTVLD